MKKMLLLLFVLNFASCKTEKHPPASSNDGTEKQKDVLVLNEKLLQIIDQNAQVETIGEGFSWTEGPLWLPTENKLIFSDIPANSIIEWTQENGTKPYVSPSGYTRKIDREGEPGSNGLLLNLQGELVLCQHGDRRMAKMLAPVSAPSPKYETLAEKYEGKQFNSPNDACYSKAGHLYFTDPPYGLGDPSTKELDYNGVYRLSADGEVTLLTKEFTRPNGIALSPDEKKLYVANSDPKQAFWKVFDLDDAKGEISKGKVFYDATSEVENSPGLPDGLKVSKNGHVFATGPGGVWILSADGKLLGKILTGERTSNCVFGPGEDYLYLTCDDYLKRIKLK